VGRRCTGAGRPGPYGVVGRVGGDDVVDAEAGVVDERDERVEAARHGGAPAQVARGGGAPGRAGVSPWCARQAELRLPWLSLVPN
jgi:hypothetical protein